MKPTAPHRPNPKPPTLEQVVQNAVASQQLEGYHCRPEQIERVREKLAKRMPSLRTS